MKGYIPSSEELTNYELGYNLADDTLSLKVDSGLVRRILTPHVRRWTRYLNTGKKVDTLYINHSKYEMQLNVVMNTDLFDVEVDGLKIARVGKGGATATRHTISIAVPPKSTYEVSKGFDGQTTLEIWAELV